MNERDRERLINRYLARLERELDDVPREARRELVEDVRGHIDEAWAASPERDQAALEGILARLGTPEALAREERERLGLGAPPAALGLLEWAAIVLTVVFVPIGLILAWLSSHWRTRDKTVATGIALAGLVLLCGLSYAGQQAYRATPAVVRATETSDPGQWQGLQAAARRSLQGPPAIAIGLVLAGVWGAPLGAAAYLALRVRAAVRRRVAILPVVAAAFAFLAIVLLMLMPLMVRP
ncbi:MAG TPA: hypothetical protein PLJ35_05735 [Anaerolineae bacterium]|nr:hypothetical protein [Anaerolineae bacterium]HOQ98304.1 hypothetical protein [Anaerolineae bacterium]HPL30484.1 hypothetical protein [Anaerolineae bacterium]